MRALRSAPSGLVFFLLTLTYIEVGNPEVTPSVGKPACITKGLKNGAIGKFNPATCPNGNLPKTGLGNNRQSEVTNDV